ncbi:MAG: hypothetical protein B7X04_04205, partial [Parcubacteria group bacterium 21-54-25]
NTSQQKAGNLLLNSSGAFTVGLGVNGNVAVTNGNVSVQGTTPTAAVLDVQGGYANFGSRVFAPEFHMNDDSGHGAQSLGIYNWNGTFEISNFASGINGVYQSNRFSVDPSGNVLAGGTVTGTDVCTTAGKCLSGLGGGAGTFGSNPTYHSVGRCWTNTTGHLGLFFLVSTRGGTYVQINGLEVSYSNGGSTYGIVPNGSTACAFGSINYDLAFY